MIDEMVPGLNSWIGVSEMAGKIWDNTGFTLFLIPSLKEKASNEGFYKKASQFGTLRLRIVSDGFFRSGMLY